MLARNTLILLLFLALTPRLASACGPDFQRSVLGSRAQVLIDLRDADIDAQAERWLPQGPRRPCGPGQSERTMPVRVDLPDGALYEAGASALRAFDFVSAAKHFHAVLELPTASNQHYSVAAAFMLGKLEAPQGHAWFAKTRELAAQGLADPLCLEQASLREDGRQHLQIQDDAAAFRDYAAAGDVFSMRVVAAQISSDSERLRRAMADATLRDWLAAWLRAGNGSNKTLQLLAKFPEFEGADAIAARAWTLGEFALSEQFAAKSRSALGYWVQAKLAMRYGNLPRQREALQLAASMAARAHDERMETSVREELMSLALGEKRYDDAALLAWKLHDQGVVAYLVEAVLDADAAIAFVTNPAVVGDWTPNQKPPPQPPLVQSADDAPLPLFSPGGCTACVAYPRLEMPWLRHLLARRLLREGRWQQAVPFFPQALQARAQAYATARTRAGKVQGIDKAEALYAAAQALHPDGMLLAGTELAPDWTLVSGSYDEGLSPRVRQMRDNDPLLPRFEGPIQGDCAEFLADDVPAMTKPGPCLETVDERQRATLHAPTLPPDGDSRFHYRMVKSELLEQASRLVPSHSQAFAALLCAASVPICYRHSQRAWALQRRFLAEGPAEPDSYAGFCNGPCPEPRFESARHLPPLSLQYRVRRAIRQQFQRWRSAWSQWGQAADSPRDD